MIPRKNAPEQISSLVENFLNHAELSKWVVEKDIKQAWPKIVGQRISEIAEIVEVLPPLLTIRVENSTWKMELSFKKQTIVEKVNEIIKGEKIKELKII